MERSFGLVGAGTMGKGLARNLLRNGFEVSVHDIDAAAVDRAVGMGAKPANGLAGLCEATGTIGTCLQSIEAIRSVYQGPDGLIANAREGSALIDFSTSDPAVTRELADEAASRAVHVVDAPMLRMEQHAWEGEVVLLVGGPEEIVERCRPAFEAVSERFVHCGPVGTGHIFKILNNVNGLCIHAMYAETFALAAKLGVDLDRLLDVLSNSTSNSAALGALSKRIVTGEDGPFFATEVALKDVSPVRQARGRHEIAVAARQRGAGDLPAHRADGVRRQGRGQCRRRPPPPRSGRGGGRRCRATVGAGARSPIP